MAFFAIKNGGFQIDIIDILDIITLLWRHNYMYCQNNTVIWHIPVTNNINKL